MIRLLPLLALTACLGNGRQLVSVPLEVVIDDAGLTTTDGEIVLADLIVEDDRGQVRGSWVGPLTVDLRGGGVLGELRVYEDAAHVARWTVETFSWRGDVDGADTTSARTFGRVEVAGVPAPLEVDDRAPPDRILWTLRLGPVLDGAPDTTLADPAAWSLEVVPEGSDSF